MPEINDISTEKIPTEVKEDDENSVDEWEIEKEKCELCKFFLRSPCKLPFKNWSKCMEKAKLGEYSNDIY